MVVGHKGVKLQRVELKAGVVDVLHILHGVLVHGEQRGSLEDTEGGCTSSFSTFCFTMPQINHWMNHHTSSLTDI